MRQELDSTATAGLIREHEDIEKVVAVMSRIADDLEHWKFIEASRLADLTSFLWTFVNGCQRALEENELFPALESKCRAHAACFLPALIDEHRKAESLIQSLSDAAQQYVTSGGARKEPLVDGLRSLVALYREHLWKEDNLLLSMMERVLSHEEQGKLYQEFSTKIPAELNELADRIEEQSNQQFSHLGEVLI